jgi:hypothetical protein
MLCCAALRLMLRTAELCGATHTYLVLRSMVSSCHAGALQHSSSSSSRMRQHARLSHPCMWEQGWFITGAAPGMQTCLLCISHLRHEEG